MGAGMSDGTTITDSVPESRDATPSCLSDPAILAQCRAKDSAVWHRVYTEAVAVVTGRALRMGFSGTEAKDICQETLLALVKEIDTVKNIAAFVRSVGYRRCVDRIRRRRDTLEYTESDPDGDDVSAGWMAVREQLCGEWIQQTREDGVAADMLEAMAMIKQPLDGMGEPCRTLLITRFSEDQAYESVATRTKLSVGQVGVYLKRCLERIRKIIKADKKLCNDLRTLWKKAGPRV